MIYVDRIRPNEPTPIKAGASAPAGEKPEEAKKTTKKTTKK